MEKNMETTKVYWGYLGRYWKRKMKTTTVYWGSREDNGKYNGNYYLALKIATSLILQSEGGTRTTTSQQENDHLLSTDSTLLYRLTCQS